MTNPSLSPCRAFSLIVIAIGVYGMVASFLFLASADFADITAGTSGFVAGAILVGSGLIACALSPDGERACATRGECR